MAEASISSPAIIAEIRATYLLDDNKRSESNTKIAIIVPKEIKKGTLFHNSAPPIVKLKADPNRPVLSIPNHIP
ncbi:hypothetical protein [Sulfuracidifex metallicus]|uniref:hypothetical protein n=1 Tax=Sulfuracidifex metallicus TaxID=47303 RepID=UPI0022732761|nr:hypothetical protein [Sulfuracidifex metallicus]MCY0850706.1 hypothetical protein [Sulfuracidifex metallicus]